MCAAFYKRGAATNAASQLEIDAVIDPIETRGRLNLGVKAFYERRKPGMLKRERREVLDSW